jgi:hypothetical protein
MLFFVALIVVTAVAAFSFQLICYMNYKKTSSPSSSLKWGHNQALQNS